MGWGVRSSSSGARNTGTMPSRIVMAEAIINNLTRPLVGAPALRSASNKENTSMRLRVRMSSITPAVVGSGAWVSAVLAISLGIAVSEVSGVSDMVFIVRLGGGAGIVDVGLERGYQGWRNCQYFAEPEGQHPSKHALEQLVDVFRELGYGVSSGSA